MDTDIVIVGAGPVGIFAAFQAGMLGMRAHLVDSLPSIGGQCTALYPEKFIYDIPGYSEITGNGLIDRLVEQASRFSPTYHINQFVTHLEKSNIFFTVRTNQKVEITAKAVIIAAGAGAFDYNKLPIESGYIYEGKSLLYSVRETHIFTDKVVVVAGGGDSAADWSMMLANFAKKVYLVHRRAKFRCAESTLAHLKTLEENSKLKILTPYQITDLVGIEDKITHVKLETLTGETVSLEADYLLAFFGLKPSLKHLENWGLDISNHCINVDPLTCATNIEGVYAIGDVAHYKSKLKLILCGFSEAAIACHHIRREILNSKAYNFQYSTSMDNIFK